MVDIINNLKKDIMSVLGIETNDDKTEHLIRDTTYSSSSTSSIFGISFVSCFFIIFCVVLIWGIYSSYEEEKRFQNAIDACGKDKACILELENARLKRDLARSEASYRSRYRRW